MPQHNASWGGRGILIGLLTATCVAACTTDRGQTAGAAEHPAEQAQIAVLSPRAVIDHALPRSLADRTGWTGDLYAGFTAVGIEPTKEHVCATVAVIEQESSFQVDPVVPKLGAIAWQEIDTRSERAHIPHSVVHGVLQLKSVNGQSYAQRIDRARTERELSDIYEDFIAAVPLGRTLFADRNPIRTRGPMQVNVVFAERYAKLKPYPYPVKQSVADEVFTRRGGIYFGVAHLLDYTAPYDRYLYRFADFNAGQYASRNAAFQTAVSRLSGRPLAADGALLPHEDDSANIGSTELAARAIAARLHIASDDIHDALEKARTPEFEQTSLYRRVFALADQANDRPLPRAALPQIELHGPKITHKLTTAWYANRVDERFHRCLRR
jgi:hypothetical protein